MIYKKYLKRIPIILLKGMFVYWIALSNTTGVFGPFQIYGNLTNFQLVLVTTLISFLIGIVIEIMKEI